MQPTVNQGKERLEQRIERGRLSGQRIVEKVMTEIPVDRIVRGSVLEFHSNGVSSNFPFPSPIQVGFPIPKDTTGGKSVYGSHPWALQQMCSRAEVPWRYAQTLFESDKAGWGAELVAHNLKTIYEKSKDRFLTREYGGSIRGFLSDKYRRLDSRPLLEAFAGTCDRLGAVPIEGYSSDTRVGLTALIPQVYEPIPGEYLAFGVMWENSDYGNGKHAISGFIDRVWCSNGAIMSHAHSQVHLGKRLSEDISFSERTYKLDTAATASAIIDIVQASLSKSSVDGYCEAVRRAAEKNIDPKTVLKNLKDLSKAEVEQISGAYNGPDVEMLPQGNTMWRLSNAVSWVAGNKVEDPERKVDLMKVAGSLLWK